MTKWGENERRRQGLDQADPQSAPEGADSNESPHSDHPLWNPGTETKYGGELQTQFSAFNFLIWCDIIMSRLS